MAMKRGQSFSKCAWVGQSGPWGDFGELLACPSPWEHLVPGFVSPAWSCGGIKAEPGFGNSWGWDFSPRGDTPGQAHLTSPGAPALLIPPFVDSPLIPQLTVALSAREVSLWLTQNKGAAPEVSAPQNPPSAHPASMGWWTWIFPWLPPCPQDALQASHTDLGFHFSTSTWWI